MPKTMAQHEKSLKSPAVCELLTLRDITDSVMVRTSGAFAAGYELAGVLSYYQTDDARNRAKAQLEALLRALPDESMRLQIRYEVTEDLGDLLEQYVHLQRTDQAELMALDAHRLAMWRNKEQRNYFFNTRLHAYLIWDPRTHAKLYHSLQRKRESGMASVSQAKCIERSRKEHEALLQEFESIVRGIETSMESAGLGLKRLDDQQLFDELKRAQVPRPLDGRSLQHPDDSFTSYRSVREQAAEASILNETETYLNLDGYLHSVVTLKELPDSTMPGMLQKLSALGFPVTVSAQAVIPDQIKVLKNYKKRLKKMISAQRDKDGHYKNNPEAKEAENQLTQIQQEIVSSSIKTIQLSLSVVVRTSDQATTYSELERSEKELSNRVQEVLNAFQRMNGAKAVIETVAKRRIFLGTLPGMGENDKREHEMLTPNAADFLPVDMPWSGTKQNPLVLFETPHRQLIPYSMFDPDLPNANGLLMGMSGSGKTLAMQELLMMAARGGALVSILERGDSYLPLVDLMGGQMIEMSLDSEQTVNAWDLRPGETEPGKNQLAYLKNLSRYMLGENTPADLDIDLLDSVLLQAIVSTYRRCRSRRSDPIPLFSDFAAELEHWQDRDNRKVNDIARLCASKLRPWIEDGPYAQLFDRPTTISLENPWLYFNIERLRDDPRLESAMSLLIAHAATYRGSGQKGWRSITVLDECWALLKSPELADLVVQLFRTARKRDASVWAISQAPEDFVGTPEAPNPYGAGILKNASTKIIGTQPGDTTPLRQHLHLNETAINEVKSFSNPKKGRHSHFLIAIGEKSESTHTLRVAPSSIDYWIATTYARERKYRGWFLHENRHLSKFEAYEELATLFPHGLGALPELPEERSGAVQGVAA